MNDRHRRVEIDDIKNLAPAADLIADLHIAKGNRSLYRRPHLGVLELSLGLLERQPALGEGKLCIPIHLFADQVVSVQGLLPIEVDLLLVELALGLVKIVFLLVALKPTLWYHLSSR